MTLGPLVALASCGGGGGSGVIIDPPPPFTLLRVEPALGREPIQTDPLIVLLFSEALDPRTLGPAIHLTEGSNDLPFSLDVTDPRTVVVRPRSELLPDREHLLVLDTALRAASGEALRERIGMQFRTAAATSWRQAETLGIAAYTPGTALRASLGAGGIGVAGWNDGSAGWVARWWLQDRWREPVAGGTGALRAIAVDGLGNAVALESAELVAMPPLQLLRTRRAGPASAFAAESELARKADAPGEDYPVVDLAGDLRGGALAGWLDQGPTNRTLGLAERTPDLGWLVQAFPIQRSPSALPRISLARGGSGLASWMVLPDSTWVSRRAAPSGLRVPEQLVEFGSGDLAAVTGGTLHVWLAGDPATPEIRFRALRSDGLAGPTERLSSSSEPIVALRVAAGDGGDVLVAWLTGTGVLFARRFDPTRAAWDVVEEIGTGAGAPRPHAQGLDLPFALAVDVAGTARIVWRSAPHEGDPVRARLALRAQGWRGIAALEPGPQSGIEVVDLQLLVPDPAIVHALWISLPPGLPGQALVRSARPR